MGDAVLDSGRLYLSFFVRRRFGPRKHDRIRLSPLKVLLYLDRHQREERVTTPLWLVENKPQSEQACKDSLKVTLELP